MVKRMGVWSYDLMGEDALDFPNGTYRVVLESDYDSLLSAVIAFLNSDMEYDDLRSLRQSLPETVGDVP